MCARSALSQPCLQHLIACMCAGMYLCDGRYLNQVQQEVSEVSLPACILYMYTFIYNVRDVCTAVQIATVGVSMF